MVEIEGEDLKEGGDEKPPSPACQGELFLQKRSETCWTLFLLIVAVSTCIFVLLLNIFLCCLFNLPLFDFGA